MKTKPDGNVAFKVTWVYNAHQGDFNAPCDPPGRTINIARERKVWCSHELDPLVEDDEPCACKILYNEGNTAPYLPRRFGGYQSPCYDAEIFSKWRFNSGYYHHGDHAGEPIPLKYYRPNKWAFLTSKRFDMPEEDRRIIGCYRVTAEEWDSEMEDWFLVGGNPKECYRCCDPNRAPRYWDFHSQKGGPRWGTGLFRYIPDDEAHAMLNAVKFSAAL